MLLSLLQTADARTVVSFSMSGAAVVLHAGPSLSRTAAERRLPGLLRCCRFRPDVEWPTFAQCLERPPIFAGFGIFPDLLGLMCH
jgi:hypothetical protein